VARGGKPINDQSRASAWHILRWAEALYIDSILIENVQEFQSWGPIGANGRPLASKRGQTFQAFLDALRSLGYVVDWRILNAADYGDPTTRQRLFIQARRGNRRISWPEATHAPMGATQAEMFGARAQWRPARDIIDWSIESQSVFSRKKPLAPATMARIAAGLRKFGGRSAEPFLVVLRNHQDASSLDKPVPTLTTSGANFALCEPFIVPLNRRKDRMRGVDEPLQTVTATSSDIGLVEPFVMSMEHSKRAPESFIMPTNHGNDGRTYSLARPMPTVTTVDAWAVVEPFLLSYYGTENMRPIGEPAPTVTTKDRFGLVEVDGMQLDIRFRMLQPHELAAAQGFPADYQFTGTREARVKQIGNAVPVNLARALCLEMVA
jgi:DNA (cytosine-5)-methyltransferase 1